MVGGRRVTEMSFFGVDIPMFLRISVKLLGIFIR
jgi:hypothetical protein